MLISSPMSRCETVSHAAVATTGDGRASPLRSRIERCGARRRIARSTAWLFGFDVRGAVAAAVARDRLGDRIGGDGDDAARARGLEGLQVGEERLAHRPAARRARPRSRRAGAAPRRRAGRANTRRASCAARACASSPGCARTTSAAWRRQTARRSASDGAPGSASPRASAASERNSHGLPIAPRPIITASQPVSSRIRCVARDVLDVAVADDRDVARQRGAHGGDRLHARGAREALRARAAVHGDHRRARVDQARANSGAFSELSSQPARCLTVTGIVRRDRRGARPRPAPPPARARASAPSRTRPRPPSWPGSPC